MTDAECDHVIDTAEPLMEKSGVIDAQTGAETFDKIRTSFGAFLPIAFDDVVARVERRAAEWAMIPSANQEQLHVLRYTVGQQYADHWDAFDANVKDKINYENGRQRRGTGGIPNPSP
jgi:prolyl 4-hydroxylase